MTRPARKRNPPRQPVALLRRWLAYEFMPLRYLCPIVLWILLAGTAAVGAQPPAQPSPQSLQVGVPQIGTDKHPVFVQILRQPNETAIEADRIRKEEKAAFWNIRIAIGTAAVLALQLLVFGWQGVQLRNSVRATRKIAADQRIDMNASIAQATRAAIAMEGVARSMEENVRNLKESVATTKEIQDTQKRVSELQLRAYVSAIVQGAVYQERDKGIYFQASVNLVNSGATPANKLIHKTNSAILPVPLPKDQQLPLPSEFAGEGMIPPHQQRTISSKLSAFTPDADVEPIKMNVGKGLYIWGEVTYEDAFGQAHETKFCLLMTWLPNGAPFGYYVPDRNSMT